MNEENFNTKVNKKEVKSESKSILHSVITVTTLKITKWYLIADKVCIAITGKTLIEILEYIFEAIRDLIQ